MKLPSFKREVLYLGRDTRVEVETPVRDKRNIPQARNDGGLEQGGNNRGEEEWLDSGYNLKGSE